MGMEDILEGVQVDGERSLGPTQYVRDKDGHLGH